MKPVNIQSLLQAKTSLKPEMFDNYLNHFGINIKAAELNDLEKLLATIKASKTTTDLPDFFVGYKIPQIGKEFDLLRFGKDSILNIEIKSEASAEKIRIQLLRNKYYLSFIGRTVCAFAFVSSSGAFYFISDDGELKTTDAVHLMQAIAKQGSDTESAPDLLFNPSDYLVSPFNSTQKFLAGEYFLTHQQEEFKSKILNSMVTATGAVFAAITGSAGTGKTLLTFDIAKHVCATGKKVLIIHCGQLNEGHYALIQNGWQITPIKYNRQYDFNSIDLIVIDEAQRIKQSQLDDIVARVNSAKCACIFSYDKVQTLSRWEAASDTAGKITAIASIAAYKLSEKIRSNKEIADFIKLLFSRKASAQIQSSQNIRISYFDNNDDAKIYLRGLDPEKWEVLRFTPSQYNNEHHEKYYDSWSKTSHKVIGQEFDGVAIAMDKFFAYDALGDLTYLDGAYYAPVKMLFQNITRARRRLDLVIIGNEEILNRCLTILK
jgi:Cdc6-like AAA superfamily ATPase